ncbi:hypothetical protein COR24_18200 [Vibrio cholerae]|nr:hypothetical protein [Vibrio cholerae]EGR5456725.1 hypothetical protein [Vibrio cholerae]EGR5464372.1 hypothetical protein [Vibrio cholerae]
MQRITLNSNTATVTTAAHWDWKRHALTVPLEAFVSRFFQTYCFVSMNRRKSRSARIAKRILTFASSYL